MSMEIVYVDQLFVTNLIIDYFILLATAKVCAFSFRRLRYLLGAIFGALWSVLSFLPPLRFLAQPLMKPVLGAAMALIAFGGEKKLLQASVVFLAVSAAFGGAVYAVAHLGGAGGVHLSLRALVLSFAVCYAVISLVFKRALKSGSRRLVLAQVRLGPGSVCLPALLDTGNDLFDPVSGRPVMVADALALSPLFPGQNLGDLAAQGPAALTQALGSSARFRLIPYSAVGTEGSLLPAFAPDSLTLDGVEEKKLLVALAPNPICPGGEYSAVI